MLINNHVWLRDTPFVTVSYPDIAGVVIKAIVDGHPAGLTRGEITRLCTCYKLSNVRLTISQLERAGIITLTGFTFTIIQDDKFSQSVIDRFTSTESRILHVLYSATGPVSTAEITEKNMMDRAQIQPAAQRLAERGFVKIHKTDSNSRKIRLHYSLNDLNTKTVGQFLAAFD